LTTIVETRETRKRAATGRSVSRADGSVKVKGEARYTAEIPLQDMAHAVLMGSTIAKGRVKSIDAGATKAAPGVLAVITHVNAPKLNAVPPFFPAGEGPGGEERVPLSDDRVHYPGQYVGLVVADTLERATHAASLLEVEYEEEVPATRLEEELGNAFAPETIFGMDADTGRGDAEGAYEASDFKVDSTYTTPTMHHNPMEPSVTVAVWEGDNLTLYDPTQWVEGTRQGVATSLGVEPEKVRVISKFIGGAFGAKALVWGHQPLAAVAAQRVGRPVKLVLTRQQMFAGTGSRPASWHRVRLGADTDGTLRAVMHNAVSQTSPVARIGIAYGAVTLMSYDCENVLTTHRLAELNANTPTAMRAPGEAETGFVLEAALDELSYAVGIDPLELRLRNYAEHEPQTELPWSSKELRRCYELGAERFGWAKRNPEPRSTRDEEGRLVGHGMASAFYATRTGPARAGARISLDGESGVRAVVRSSTVDMGTGTYTVMAQIAADALGLDYESVAFELGDSRMPMGGMATGSMTVNVLGPAVEAACRDAVGKLVKMAVADPDSPLFGLDEDEVAAEGGRLSRRVDAGRGEGYAQVLDRSGKDHIQGEGGYEPGGKAEQYSASSFGAHFVEVRVDEAICQARVRRMVGVFDVGRVVNPKTARSQCVGGMTFGLGMAMGEETVTDRNTGLVVEPHLSGYSGYHVPVAADVHEMDVVFVEGEDAHNSLGVKGVGELGIVGATGAIANAIHHATGKRVRDLPITPEKLL